MLHEIFIGVLRLSRFFFPPNTIKSYGLFLWQGCRNGDSCLFSHDQSPSKSLSFKSTLCLPEDGIAHASTLEKYFPKSGGCILVMDDAGFHFSSNLARHCDPSKIICTTNLSHSDIYDASLNDAKKFWELSHPDETIISNGENQIPWYDVKCILWFPRFASSKENLDIEKILLQNFFDLLAIRILADALHGVQVILTMNNIRFSQLQVIFSFTLRNKKLVVGQYFHDKY